MDDIIAANYYTQKQILSPLAHLSPLKEYAIILWWGVESSARFDIEMDESEESIWGGFTYIPKSLHWINRREEIIKDKKDSTGGRKLFVAHLNWIISASPLFIILGEPECL